MKDFVEYTNATLQWRSCIEGLKARACNFQRRETKRYILCVIYKNVDSIKDVIVQMSSPVLHYFQNPYIQKIIENLYHKNFLGGVTNFFFNIRTSVADTSKHRSNLLHCMHNIFIINTLAC